MTTPPSEPVADRQQPTEVAAPKPLVEPQPGEKVCSCGHGQRAHTHYRRGKDCAVCSCGRFRQPLLSRLGLRR
ncbi:hypothetical protein [Blastococcus tunisiensis]|uniref:Uncharacterized protein n=1 Tax=Blastococcus tunisiensis TaxID=1798228 RepID=A0A1I2J9Y1_9ACTN|nr:hypothetical protein [Blastococcus sp. DSM 46838]SFF51324.1 hypothetical protein SAMN05216574_115114 [Blastococcus sp. DSM 46838]